jgi:oxygen-independent coproporphyrinogen-3 oxidase
VTTSGLFAKYDVPVPRYTSYPTVPEWHDAPTTDQWAASVSAALDHPAANLAIYIHLPFCESLCTFCGCNTVITRDHGRAAPYVERVLAELDAYLSRIPLLGQRRVTQIHLGGGTPTFASADELARLIDGVFRRMNRDESGVFQGSVEADPRVTSTDHLATLRKRGFSRLSLGIQDFNPETQRLVNRVQSAELVARQVDAARTLGYESVNFDLIYGLPGQTPDSMRATADEVLARDPDRLAIYSFARVPWIKPQQRRFTDDQIPAGAEKRRLYETIRAPLVGRGYVELGLDHFSKPDDGLARAAAAGTMHRNFQGYTETPTTVLLGLGVSAISETDDCYHQNEKVITRYERRVDSGEIPTLRGHRLSTDDHRRRARIRTLMTAFRVPIDPDEYADAASFLRPLIDDGLVTLREDELRVTDAGRPFLRNAAVFFDKALRESQPTTPTYSTAI